MTQQKNKREDSKVESDDSPEIPDRKETSEIPSLPSRRSLKGAEVGMKLSNYTNLFNHGVQSAISFSFHILWVVHQAGAEPVCMAQITQKSFQLLTWVPVLLIVCCSLKKKVISLVSVQIPLHLNFQEERQQPLFLCAFLFF